MWEVTIRVETKKQSERCQVVEYSASTRQLVYQWLQSIDDAYQLTDSFIGHIEIIPPSQTVYPDEPEF